MSDEILMKLQLENPNEAVALFGVSDSHLKLLDGREIEPRRAGLVGGQRQVEQSLVPAGNLDALIAQPRDPVGDAFQAVERRGVARELGEEDRRALDGLHGECPFKR